VPELPEVQTIVDVLNASGLPGCRIREVSVFWPKTIATSSPESFCSQLAGRTISAVRRRAKYIILELIPESFLLIHLRMTGRLELMDKPVTPTAHVHVVLELDHGRSLVFQDTRKFGRFFLTSTPDRIIGALGPEPLTPAFSAQSLAVQLNRHQRMIKPLLLDQTFVSGLGNIYVDEALWTASIHPQRPSHSLSWQEIKALHRAIRSVLRQAIRNGGTSLGTGKGNYVSPHRAQGSNGRQLNVFRRAGQPCKRCGRTIQRIVVAQRGTHVCPGCQCP
jgi:formamidopyrimidine-DNA glycosylase